MRGTKVKKEKGENLKSQKAITLIALVITIIILLILAAVSIATLTGENGILKQINEAKEETEMSGIKEDVELIKNEEYIKNIIKKEEELTQQELLNLINLKYENSYYVGNKIITADKKYQILVRNDEELTVIVSKYNGGSLEPGELSMDLVEDPNLGTVEVYVSIGGIQSYKQYVEEYLQGKDKKQLLLQITNCSSDEEFLGNFSATTYEEVYAILGVSNIDEIFIKFQLIPGYEQEANEINVNVSGGSGINTNINLAETSSVTDIVYGNGTYKYIATSGGNSVEEEITISSIDEDEDDPDIFTYDETTGYITGLKPEYISSIPIQAYHESNPKYLIKGAPILHIPSEIDGTVIKGIDYGAFMEVMNITKLILPDTLEVLGEDSFFFCRNLRYIEIPDSITTIKQGALWQTAIEEIFIPSTVTTLERGIIYNSNEKITTIYCEAASKPSTWNSEWINTNYADKYIIKWGQTKEDISY